MPDIRLVALDLDGTVFNDEKEITPRTLEAIRAAIAKGVDVIPATGRVASGVPEAFLRIPGVRYALTSNGASVVELSTGKPLVNLPFDAALASDIYDIVAATGGAMGIFIGGKAYTDYFGANDGLALMPPALRRYLRDSRIVVDDMHAVFAAHPTKGSGLKTLADTLGLAMNQVMACGDSGNDLAMIQAAGYGIAMGNATPDVLAAARYVTDDNNHDGVAKAIETYVLKG